MLFLSMSPSLAFTSFGSPHLSFATPLLFPKAYLLALLSLFHLLGLTDNRGGSSCYQIRR